MRRGRWLALLAIAALPVVRPVVGVATDGAAPMVEDLRARGIRDERVLDAFRRVRREAFVPDEERRRAYDDTPLPIGRGQTISQPYIVALMTDLLQLRGDERVLEIGTGSGYQAAILATLARDVYSVEIVPELATSARLRLTREGYRNVHVKLGDGTFGWREYGPYDAIVVTAAAPTVPRPLIQQLKEGGILVMPLGEQNGRQVLVRGVMRAGKLRTREITDVRFVPMTGRAAQPERAEQPERRQRPPQRDVDQPQRREPPAERDLDQRERQPLERDLERPERQQRPLERDDEQPLERDREQSKRLQQPMEREDEQPLEREDEAPLERDRGIREERLRDQDEDGPESDRQSRPPLRTPVVRAPAARAYGRRCASGAAVRAGDDSLVEAQPAAG